MTARSARSSGANLVRLTSFESVPLEEAVEAYLAERDLAATSRRKYRDTLAAMVEAIGAGVPVADVDGRQLVALMRGRWDAAAPATWNRQRACLRSFFAYCRRQHWVLEDPSEAIERRREPEDQTRSIPAAELEALWRRRDVPLRERALWRLLYESAARAEEILGLDAGDIDLPNRRATVTGKGGGRELVHFQTTSARLVARLLSGRRSGPVFVSSLRPSPTRAPARADVDPESGHGRLSYRRAAELFSEYSSGRTLHQLRHTALTELAEANVSLPLLMAKSRHRSLRSLQRYARPGPEAVAALTASMDPERRRR
jgi:integrase